MTPTSSLKGARFGGGCKYLFKLAARLQLGYMLELIQGFCLIIEPCEMASRTTQLPLVPCRPHRAFDTTRAWYGSICCINAKPQSFAGSGTDLKPDTQQSYGLLAAPNPQPWPAAVISRPDGRNANPNTPVQSRVYLARLARCRILRQMFASTHLGTFCKFTGSQHSRFTKAATMVERHVACETRRWQENRSRFRETPTRAHVMSTRCDTSLTNYILLPLEQTATAGDDPSCNNPQ
jgi:hypothetical protein